MSTTGRNRNKKIIPAVALMALLSCAGVFLWHQWNETREAVHGSVCKGRLYSLGFQLHVYHEAEGAFPPAYVSDANGKPLYSWRVLLAPSYEWGFLDRYHPDAAWDDEANLKLAQDEDFVNVFACPSHPEFQDPLDAGFDAERPRYTNYVAVVGPGTVFPGTGETISLDEITDGAENTILLVEIANSDIHWSEPRDLRFEEMSFQINDPAKPSISSHHPTGPGVVFADGRYFQIADSMPPETLKALLTINGGEGISRKDAVQAGWLH